MLTLSLSLSPNHFPHMLVLYLHSTVPTFIHYSLTHSSPRSTSHDPFHVCGVTHMLAHIHTLSHGSRPLPTCVNFVEPFTYLLTHSLTHSLTHLLIHSLTHSFTLFQGQRSMTPPMLAEPLTHLFRHSPIHSLTRSLTRSLTHTHSHADSLFPSGQPATTPPMLVEPIPEYTASEELEEERSWRVVQTADGQFRIDMKVIEPYKKVLSHGGKCGK